MRKAIATIETAIGPMMLYYNGAGEAITAECSYTVEELDTIPATINEAINTICILYRCECWNLDMMVWESDDILEYVEILEAAGEKMTEQEWREWIEHEIVDTLTNDPDVYIIPDADAIITKLDKDGFIKKEV